MTLVLTQNADRKLQYNNSNPRFTTYSSSQKAAYLYVKQSTATNPSLSLSKSLLDITAPYNANGTGSFTITAANLTDPVTIGVTGTGYSVSPASISAANANGATVTVTYSGNSDTDVTGEVTVISGSLSESVDLVARKEKPAMPTFSPDGGNYDIGQSVEVSLSHPGNDVIIHYTTDGNDPTTNSSVYNGAITVSETKTLKAIAVYGSSWSSEVATAQFNFEAPGSTCPIMIVFDNTATNTLPGTGYHVSAPSNPSSVVTNSSSTSAVYEETNGIRIGSGSATGSFTLNLASPYNKVKKVVISAKPYGSDTGVTAKVEVGGDTQSNTLTDSDFADYTFNFNNNSSPSSVTISSAASRKRFYVESITIHYVCNDPNLTVTSDNPLLIIDTNESGTRTESFTVSGSNLGNNHVTISADASHSTNFSFNPNDITPNNGVVADQSVDVTYNGYALSATGVANVESSGAETKHVNVEYLYDGPIYIVGDLNGSTWNTQNGLMGVQMDKSNGVYTKTITAYAGGEGYAWMYFTKSLNANSFDALGDNRFGPRCNDNYGQPMFGQIWEFNENTLNGEYCDLDTVYKLNTIKLRPGLYTFTINPATNQFMIEKYVINVTISPEDGTTFTGNTINGTITDSPAGTIEWSTDGTNWQTYNASDGFTAMVNQVGGSVTIYARSTSHGVTSQPVSATYTRVSAPAPAAPVFSRKGGDVAAGTVVTITAPEGCTLFVNDQEVTSPYNVTINSATTISAYCVNDEGTPSTTVSYSFNISSVCDVQIVFKDNENGSDASSEMSSSSINNYYESGSEYVNSVNLSKVFQGKTGIKFGSGSAIGSITFNLKTTGQNIPVWKIKKIILNAAQWVGSSVTEGVLNVTTNLDNTGVTHVLSSSTLNDYEYSFNGDEISSFTISTTTDGRRAYVKSITIIYDCSPEVDAPVITPATGTYYESQNVTMTCETSPVTIYYTTDGTDPTTSSAEYNGQFTAPYTVGGSYTIKAIAVYSSNGMTFTSGVTTETYTWGVPEVVIVPDSRNVASESVTVTMSGTPTGAAIYYTTDGNDPTTSSTLYEGAFSVSLPNVGDHVTVKAIAVYNGVSSEVATATYTRVEKMIDVHAPFFSPLEGKDGGYSGIYYGDQTLQIATSTENADIYYVIEEVSGTNPSASVADPTKSSTHYTGPIDMTVGNSYRVKAIAYIGDFASTVSEGYYIIKDPNDIDWPSASEASYYVTSCKEFNELSSSNAGTKFIFANPVQVVYHSTYVNNGTSAEYCYVRDNTDYACIYFGKADTHNYHIFEMGDWIAGATIEGPLNVYEHNYHNQLGTSAHTINATLWPSQRIGWSEIVPETTTCTEIASGTPAAGNNKWGHYVHVRYSTMSGVHDETGYQPSGNYDMKHTGSIQDQTSQALDYYDKFYLWSAGTCRYSGTTYTINAKGDYTQDFFDAKQNAGATFDVYGVVDWYGTDGVGTFQVCPIDFLWIYKPVITVNPGNTVGGEADTYAETQIVSISATQPEWAAENVVIYYKTDDMDDWAEYIGPFEVSSNTTVQTYAQVEAIKNDAAHTNYNDIMRSITISKEFKFEGIEDPEIAPASMVIEVISGNEKVEGVVIADNNDENSGAVTVYTTDGSIPSATNGTQIAASDIVELDDITETTTITAISYLEVKDAQGNVTSTLWSNPVTVTYTFVKKNGVIYDLVTEAPQEGNVYVIVNKDAYMGLSTKQNDNNRGSVGVMFVDDATKEQVYGNDELALFVLEKASAGRYYFKNINGDGYLTVAGNAGLRTGDKDFYAEAGIQVGVQDAGYPAIITFSYDGTPRVMRYFAKGRTFSTYSDASLNENVFLYGVEATPLAYIEATPSLQGKQVTVSDQLIGTWYVKHTEGNVVHPLLIAKDQNYANVKTFINTDLEQKDYMRDVLGWQTRDWDQSNWVVLDFMDVPNGVEAAEALVGKKIKQATVTGVYLDKDNYTIMLEGNAPIADGDVSGDYPGYMGGLNILAEGEEEESPKLYQYAYNTYMPANFLNANLNLDGNEGFVAQAGAAAPSHVGERLFFVNPKVMEVVRVWGVWAGNDVFTVYEPDQKTVNGWGIEGGFGVNWSYNRLNASGEPINYGYPTGLDDFKDKAYLFHAMIARKTRNTLRANGTADSTPSLSEEFVLYPLDIPSDASNYTAVRKVNAVKEVVSVRYYNVMGMESEKPFEGINIVVTRYSDGSASTVKVLR